MTAVNVLFLAPANFIMGLRWNSIPGGNLLCGVLSLTALCNFHAALIPQEQTATAMVIVIQPIPRDRRVERTAPAEVRRPPSPVLSFSEGERQAGTRADLTFRTHFACRTLERRQEGKPDQQDSHVKRS